MGKNWPDCILTLIDIKGAKKVASDGLGSKLMRELHRLVAQRLTRAFLPSIDHAYAWNDSVLLLSYVTKGDGSYERALRDAELLKKQIDDEIRTSYAIAVKGQTFPSTAQIGVPAYPSRVAVVEASSWALANCFKIDNEMRDRKDLHGLWYVDQRVASQIQTSQPCKKVQLPMFPKDKRRRVHIYEGYLW